MGTDLNLDVLRGMGFELPDGVGANDLIVAIRAEDDDAVTAAEEALAVALAAEEGRLGGLRRRARGHRRADHRPPPRRRRDGTLALISLPGQHAFTEAFDALSAGLDVMLFSDNVTLAQEIRLKDEAAQRGLLVMGPDCGTAVVGGVGLGFANVVAPGPVGHRGRLGHRGAAGAQPAGRRRGRGAALPWRRGSRPERARSAGAPPGRPCGCWTTTRRWS